MDMTRRAVLGAALSAVGGASLATRGAGIARAQPATSDPVMQRTIDELGALVHELQSQTPVQRGTLQSLAVSTRLLSASCRAGHVDRRLRRAMQRAIAADGRERLIDRAMSPDVAGHMRRSLDRLGVRPEQTPTDRDGVSRVLNSMLAGRTDHLVSTLDQTAALLEQYRAGIVRSTPDGRANIVVVQGLCPSFQWLCNALSWSASLICALAPFDPAIAPACLATTLEAAAVCAIASTCN